MTRSMKNHADKGCFVVMKTNGDKTHMMYDYLTIMMRKGGTPLTNRFSDYFFIPEDEDEKGHEAEMNFE